MDFRINLLLVCLPIVAEAIVGNATMARRTGPKLNTKQALIVNQVIASYALSGVEDELCRNHTERYKEALRLFEPWALQMVDASSKLQAGLIVGNIGDFGSFEQCLQIYADSEYGPIRGQLCSLNIIPGPNLTKIFLRMRNFSDNSFDRIRSTMKFNDLWTVCLPDSCPVSDVERHFQKVFKGITEGLDVNISLDEDGCSSYKNRKPISKVQWVVITALLSFLGFILICTVYDVIATNYYGEESINQFLSIFSAYSNAKIIFSSENEGGTRLSCVNGIRSLSIFWIILGHRYFNVMYVPIVNGVNILDWMETFPSTLIVGATVSVDVFFMISGLLVSYLFLNAMSKGVTFNLILFYLHRYMRVTPVLGVMVLFYTTLIELFGSGPVWNSSVHGLRDPCLKYWWSCLLHIQNYLNPHAICIVQTWYLTCDMQFYFYSPVFLYPLWKWPHFGIFLVFLGFLVTIGINFYFAWLYELNGGMPITNEVLGTKHFQNHYITPYIRASPYFVGLALGFILHQTKGKKIKINTSYLYGGWLITLATLSSVVFGDLPFQLLDHPYNRLEASLYQALSRPAFAIGVAWVVFNCVHGTGGLANSILSWHVFHVTAKLTYCMFLTHLLIIFLLGAAEKTSFYFSQLNMIYMFFGDLAFTLIAAFILSVSFEMPIIRLDEAFRKKGTKP